MNYRFRFLPLFFISLSIAAIFSGCLSDPLTGPEVKSRVIQRPGAPMFRGISFDGSKSGDMLVTWLHNPSDTQSNFRGYYIKLYTSADSGTVGSPNEVLLQLQNQNFIPVSFADTFYVYKNIVQGRYTIEVWGVRYPDPQHPDSLVLSKDSNQYSNNFDPRPLDPPDSLRAASAGGNIVNLKWKLPKTDDSLFGSTAGYIIYYHDPNRSAAGAIDSNHYFGTVFRHTDSAQVTVPSSANQSIPGSYAEHAFVFVVKSLRIDQVQSKDSATIVWSGAEMLPAFGDSAGGASFRHTIFIGGVNGRLDMIDDTTDQNAQVAIDTSNGKVTLTGLNGAQFLQRTDRSPSFRTTYYLQPVDFVNFTNSVTLDQDTLALGETVYLQIPGSQAIPRTTHTRLFIVHQANGKWTAPGRGIIVSASFQPQVDNSGKLLPYF